ncbi:hypothetical protein ANN_24801 [Periplaneta americana]|uniref:DDE Tnp4 domain-containing protein n=1 Tax=Periplaneta americana TaxID=6978 RepID=A0ABQ8S057_PERAM|nr:hypothetical protein ANN_24801 [Periplaneta americana]
MEGEWVSSSSSSSEFEEDIENALVDADYKFITIDVGSYGRNSDGCVFANSRFGKKKLESNTLNVPQNAPLVENGEPQPHITVGDEAFPLKKYLLRPYGRHHLDGDETKKIFNYRLSRARNVVENAFGILTARWRIFRRYMEVQPNMVDRIVLASCCLHNMLCKVNMFEPDVQALSLPTCALRNLDHLRRNSTCESFQVRENFKEYFNSLGSVPWQLNVVHRGRSQN